MIQCDLCFSAQRDCFDPLEVVVLSGKLIPFMPRAGDTLVIDGWSFVVCRSEYDIDTRVAAVTLSYDPSHEKVVADMLKLNAAQ